MNIFRNLHTWIANLLSLGNRWDDYTSPIEEKTVKVLEELDIDRSKQVLKNKKTTFDPNSYRAKQGIAFQKSIFGQLQEEFPGKDTFEECWDYFKAKDPTLSIYELACLEKEWGDITFVYEGQRFWVECCFAIGKKSSWFCEMKRIKFQGVNKWYCWGKIDQPGKSWYIQSRPWNDYVEKCDKVKRGKKSFRVVPKHLIGDNLYSAKRGASAFREFIA